MSTKIEKVGPQISSSRVKSGIPGLDPLLDGGFPAGKVVLILGEPGTGKTILCSVPPLGSFSDGRERRLRWDERAKTSFHGGDERPWHGLCQT